MGGLPLFTGHDLTTQLMATTTAVEGPRFPIDERGERVGGRQLPPAQLLEQAG